MKFITIFASGRGSNAEKIIEHLQGHPSMRVGLIISNKEGAGVLQLAEKYAIASHIISKDGLKNEVEVRQILKEASTDFIVLAGFLLLIPQYLIKHYPGKIVNIHPALLPRYGGKGMYGMHVHQAVVAAGDKRSGITIHYVNEQYDDGAIIFQVKVLLMQDDSAAVVAKKVLQLEHRYYPHVVESLVNGL